jgi:hypothetical protein
MEFWSTDHYRVLYRLVPAEREKIERVMKENQIVCRSID